MIKKLLTLGCLLMLVACAGETEVDIYRKVKKACEAGDLEAVKSITKKHPESLANKKYNLLYPAAVYNRLDISKWLIENGVDVAFYDKFGQPIVYHCSKKKDSYELIKYLVEKGAPVNSEDNKQSALHVAALDSKDALVQLLIEGNANVNAIAGITTPLDSAYDGLDIDKEKAQKCIDLLKKHGAKRYSELPQKDVSK